MNQKQQIGSFGEKLAQNFLIKKNYQILDFNIKIGYYEIDIIAKKEKYYIFIEVKTRSSSFLGSAETALNSQKMRNFKKAVLKYASHHKINENLIKLEFIAVDIDKNKKIAKIKHFEDII